MKDQAIFLSVGRADSNILFLNINHRRQCIVIDAGGFPPQADRFLRERLLENGVETIDLMIITHLHADHLSALHTLKGQFTIKQLVLPIAQPLGVSQRVLDTQPGNKYLLNLAMLDDFIRHCRRQGTQIQDVMTYAGGGEIHLGGGYGLRCLYPFKDSRLPSVEHGLKMCEPGLPQEACIAHETLSRMHANGDSAVWLLQKDGQDLVLYAADAPEETLLAILQREALHPQLVRLPHHGLPQGYFSAELIKALSPRQAVVSTSLKMKERVLEPCMAMAQACGVPIHFTFNGDFNWPLDP